MYFFARIFLPYTSPRRTPGPDGCRFWRRVVFEDVDALVEAIRRVRDDPELVLVGRKNSLSLAHDSTSSAGYRNVTLSVLVVDPFTTSQGLETHVCELQFGLKDVEALRNDAGHANYITWRDINAE